MDFVVPENVVTHFHVRPGDQVGDFGAGSGHFTRALARELKGEGKVYVVEIVKEMVSRLAEMARTEHLTTVEVLWADLERAGGTKLADSILDAGVLANTLFQLEDKDTAVAEIARVTRSGGKLFVIDWTDSFGGMGPESGSIISEADARALIERHGFVYERSFPAGAHHYGLAFRKT